MAKRTRAAREYGRAIEWLASHAPVLALPISDYVGVLREECARLRIEVGALRAANEPDAIDPTPEWNREPAPAPWAARAAELLAEQEQRQRPRPTPTTWLPRPDPAPPARGAGTPGIGR